MKKKILSRKAFGFFLALILVLCVMAPLYALDKAKESDDDSAGNGLLQNITEVFGAEDDDADDWIGDAESGISFCEVEADEVSVSLLDKKGTDATATEMTDSTYEPTDIVRVSIVLEGQSTIEKGYDVMGIAENDAAMSYRQKLQTQQDAVTRRIENKLDEALDVQWNLTLAANIISANVEYGQIETIKNVFGVKDVEIEAQYLPVETVEEELVDNTVSPQMELSGGMTGMTEAWDSGYTGAGRRVAIIDTGIDPDHQSFAADAFDYSLKKTAELAGVSVDSYNLLDADELEEKAGMLNVQGKAVSSGKDLFVSNKIAFGFNYVDCDYNISHDKDSQTDHGSHVSGIAAANRYIETSEGVFKDAFDVCKVVGNAPDAQLLIMKVFGVNGGAYDSDYMAAIEDALILGADSVNLSLGATAGGFSQAGVYQYLMEKLEASGTVVCVAAGNSGNWSDHVRTEDYLGAGYLYTDQVTYNTISTPGSYTNVMTVASVNNSGQISNALYRVTNENGESCSGTYSETTYNVMKEFTSLDTSGDGSGTTYDFVFIDGYGQAPELEHIDVKGKIFICSRGNEVTFYDKAGYAVENGAVATIVYNNVDGTAGMDMSDYHHEEPAVMITKQAAAAIKALAARQTDSAGNLYYTGKMTVISGLSVIEDGPDYYSMSDFSSWGTTGDLALKPEITAPGGSIFSVKGDTAATDTYKTNSGTSMATPQVSGITALIRQYIEAQGWVASTGFTARQLSQSLLMSTADPLKDGNGNYYSLLQQGAGLANSGNAVNADTFIMMEDDASPSAGDGKVKAELGDDPQKTGIYEFSFDIYNTSGEEKGFELSADVFTQDYFEGISNDNVESTAYYMKQSTTALDSYAVFSENGKAQLDGTVTVPAKGSVKVKARIVISDKGKAVLDKYFPRGTYLQAFVYAKPKASSEGVVTSAHSIPVLAFYGNWTDVAMYDGGSFDNGQLVSYYCTDKTSDGSRTSILPNSFYDEDPDLYPPYLTGSNHVVLSNNGESYAYGGNPLVSDSHYYSERDAVSSNATVVQWSYMPIRDFAVIETEIVNKTTNKTLFEKNEEGNWNSPYYDKSASLWQGGWADRGYGIDYSLNEQVKAGDELEFSFAILPEYYRDYAMGAKAEPGSGGKLTTTAKVDDAAPVLKNLEYDASRLTLNAQDDNYVAAAVLYNEDGTEILDYVGAVQEASVQPGEALDYVLENGAKLSGNYLIQIYDYAMNVATYRVKIAESSISFRGSMLGFDLESGNWVQVDPSADKLGAVTETTRVYTAASAVEDTIYAVAYDTQLYRLSVKDPAESAKLGEIGYTVVDMAYNVADGKMYGVTDKNMLITIDMETGRGAEIGTIPFTTNTLACDAAGTFYSSLYGTGKVYSYTLDALKSSSFVLDLNGDGVFDNKDSQALLDHVSGKALLDDATKADVDGDGDVDTYDVYLLFDKLPGRVHQVADIGVASKYMQAMEVDPNSNELYWMSYSTSMFGSNEVGFSVLYKIDAVSGQTTRYQDVWDQVSSFVILDKDAGSIYEPINGTDKDFQAGKNAMTDNSEQAAIAALVGVDNTVKNDVVAEGESGTLIEVPLYNSAASTNGLFTLVYPSDAMGYVSVQSDAELTSLAQTAEGTLTFAYADQTQFIADSKVATVIFRVLKCDGDVAITEKEINYDHVAVESSYDGGAHQWGDWLETSAATCVDEGVRASTCSLCGETKTETIPVNENAHDYSEWNVVASPAGNDPGTESRTCSHCGRTESRWTVVENAEITAAERSMSVLGIHKDYLGTATVGDSYGLYLNDATKLTTTDGSLRYFVTLGDATPLNGVVKVKLSTEGIIGAGYGYAIKKDIVESVGWDSDELDYDIPLENGIGTLTAYSYYNSSSYTTLKIYFSVNEGGYGIASPLDTGDKSLMNGDGYIKSIGVLNGGISSSVWEETVDDNNHIVVRTGYVYLDPKATAKDALLHLAFDVQEGTAGRSLEIYSGHDAENHGENLRDSGMDLQLVNGLGKAEFCTSYGDNGYLRKYTVYFEMPGNVAPSLVAGVGSVAEAKVKVAEAFTLNLDEIFADVNGDALSYTVSVNGAEAVAVNARYSFTPDTDGTVTLVFYACDGALTSEAYTVTLTVLKNAVFAGDLNDDGVVDMRDITLLRRYVAGWDVVVNVENGDVNADGIVDMKDITLLRRYVAGWDVTLG